MKTYKIYLYEDNGSWALDALAATVGGNWHNHVSNFDGKGTDFGMIDIETEAQAEYLESLLRNDDNVIEWKVQ